MNSSPMAMPSMKESIKAKMHEPAMAKKTLGGLTCSVLMNIVFAVLFALFAFPASNPDTYRLYEKRWAERDLFDNKDAYELAYPDGTFEDQATFEETYTTEDERMQFWGQGFCFYAPTTSDGIDNQVAQWNYDPENSNQRCVTCEFVFFMLVWFNICCIKFVIHSVMICAFKTHSEKLFSCSVCMDSMLNCFGFITFICASYSRFSEGGRACSGEFWSEQGYTFGDLEASCMNLTGCMLSQNDEDSQVAALVNTGRFLGVIIVLGWIMMFCGCMCMCCMAVAMMKMMSGKCGKMQDACGKADAQAPAAVNQTESVSTTNM